jgi:hypothetical protein
MYIMLRELYNIAMTWDSILPTTPVNYMQVSNNKHSYIDALYARLQTAGLVQDRPA